MVNRRVMTRNQAPTAPLRFLPVVRAMRPLKVLCAVTALSALVAGCSNTSPGEKSAAAAKRISVISPHSDDIRDEFARAWKAKNPNIEIKWVDQGGSSDALNFVQARFKQKPEGIGHDCFFGGGPDAFTELETDGLLTPLPSDYGVPADLNGVPLRGANNTWVAAALSGFGILVNTSIATRDALPVPKVWGDLGNPQLINRVELADPRRSGSAHAAYEIILQTNGWDQGWKVLSQMAANSRRFARGSSELPHDVASGEAVMAPAIDFYARAAIARANGKLSFVSPQGQSVVTADPIAILKGAPNAEGARKFVEFVMSPEGQKLWMLKKGASGGPTQKDLFRQAALPSLYQPIPKDSLITQNPYSVKNARRYDSAKAAKRRKALDELIGAVLIDNHDAVKAKWAKNPDPKTFGYVPLSEAEMMKAAEQWGDAAFATKTTTAWGEASKKYFQP
ncbi:MAG: iron(III) transport system substrate-binding protein [Abditibacteriota bacterium]|nr:iron(III) transport system substrate-binding protein [Abditibacteriota bacterium]